MKIFIVEDEIFQLEDVQIILEELGHECIGHTDDPFEAQERIGDLLPDAVLVDIHLHHRKSGIKLAARLKSLFQIPIIFTTTDQSDETMAEALETEPVTFLTKPIHAGDLKAALMMAQNYAKLQQKSSNIEDDLYIRHLEKLVKVSMREILYVFSDSKNYCSLIVKGGKKYTFRNSVTGFLKLLDDTHFIQVHRSHVINLNHIQAYHEGNQSIELSGFEVPVGRAYKQELFKRMKIVK